jgi:hypothetical protein
MIVPLVVLFSGLILISTLRVSARGSLAVATPSGKVITATPTRPLRTPPAVTPMIVATASPDAQPAQYMSMVMNAAFPLTIPARVTGRILEDGRPRADTVVRLAEVWCSDYEACLDCCILLDEAFDPGDCTEADGSYEMVVAGWYLRNVRGWVLIAGHIDQDDYFLVYEDFDDVIEVIPGYTFDAGAADVSLNNGYCLSGPEKDDGPGKTYTLSLDGQK